MKRWLSSLIGGLSALLCASVLNAQVLKVEVLTPTNESSLGFAAGSRQAKASASVSGGLVTGLTIANRGAGYSSNPTLTFSGGSGEDAAASAVVGFPIASISITNGGTGYDSAPNVTVSAPGGWGIPATATATISATGVVDSITIVDPGSGYTSETPPTVTIAPPANANSTTATATAVLGANGVIKSVELTSPGQKYLSKPSLTISGGGGTGASITVDGVTDIGVSSVDVSDTGSGYSAVPTVKLVGGGGEGATATAELTANDGLIKSIAVTNSGSGYVSAPTVVIDPPDGVVVIKGRISGTASIFTTTFYVDGKKVGEISDHMATEVSCSWTPPQPGAYYVTIKTVDKLTNEATSLPVRVFIEGTAIVSPVSGTIVPRGSSVVITAEATRAQGFIKKIQFFVTDPSGTKTSIGTDSTAPYSVPFAPPANGTYQLTAIATDNNDVQLIESTVVPIQVVTPIGEAPTVNIVNPVPGSSISAGSETNVIADAKDSDGFINKVEFYLNGNLMGTSQSFPYTVSWQPQVAGEYSIVAMAFDDKGNVKASEPALITVKAGFPTVAIASPTNGTASIIQGSKVPVTVRAAGSDGGITSLATINLLVDGVITDTLPKNPEKLDPPPPLAEPFVFDWKSNVSLGTHVLAAKVTDANGLSITSAEVTVTVIDNKAPSVAITNLTDGSTFPLGQVITVNASATDVDGSVAQVAFSINGVQLAGSTSYPNPDTTSPYSVQYTPPGVGTYTVQAIATDNLGVTSNSTVITFTVAPPVGQTPYVGLSINDPSVDYSATPSTSKTGPIEVMYGSKLLLCSNALDVDGTVTQVEFYVNGTKVAEDSSAPYNYTYLLNQVGSVEIVAVATDNDGNRVSSTPVSVTSLAASGTEKYIATLSSPKAGTFYRTGQNIVFLADSTLGNASGQKIDFYWNNSQVYTAKDSPYQYNIGIAAPGTYEVRAVARLGTFTTVSEPATITIGDNQLPVVSLTNPVEGSIVKTGVPLLLKASATDPDGSILKVQFLVNGNVVSTVDTLPYQYSWTPPSPGKYSITAIATDTSQRSNVTAPVNISVAASSPPTVTLTSPTIGASFKTTAGIYLSATAADVDGTISYVRFYDNGVLLTKVTAAPYVHTYVPASPGVHTLTAEAVDDSGNSTFSAPVPVSVENNAPPIVSVTSPSANASVLFGSKVFVSAFAYDPDGSATDVLSVELFANDMKLGTAAKGSSPYQYSVGDWMPPAVGTWTIKAKATDKSGNQVVSAGTTLVVKSATTLQIALSGIAQGASYVQGTSLNLRANITGGSGNLTVAFFANGSDKDIVMNTADMTSAVWTPSSPGTYDVVVTVTDQLGLVTSSTPVRVTISANTAPTVSITSPVTGNTVSLGNTIRIKADAADSDGVVSKVVFRVNGDLLATVSTYPFETSWQPVSSGTAVLTAEATDNQGVTGTSAPVGVEVSTPGTATRYYSGDVIAGTSTIWRYALMVRRGSSAIFMAYTTTGTARAYYFAGLTLDSQNVVVAKSSDGVERLRGTVTETGFIGTFTPDSTAFPFIGILSQAGASSVLAGLYSGSVVGVSDSSFQGIVLPDGRLFAALFKGASYAVGSVSLGTSTSFTLTTLGGTQIAGTFSNSSTLLTGTVTGPLAPGQLSAALSTGPELTDAFIRGLSTRGWVGTGNQVMIAGFAVSATSSEPVLLKVTGPSLVGSVSEYLSNPKMLVYSSTGAHMAALDSDDYALTASLSSAFKYIGLQLPGSPVESASNGQLSTGAYAAVVSGSNGGTGNAMIEVYDGGSSEAFKSNRIHAISTRGYVGTGDASLIAGFIVDGKMPVKVVIQAIGPTLSSYDSNLAQTDLLQDPVLRIVRLTDGVVLRENDDWCVGNEATVVAEAVLRGGATGVPSGSKDAAIVISLPAGAYGAVVSGKNGGTGIALVQVYEVR